MVILIALTLIPTADMIDILAQRHVQLDRIQLRVTEQLFGLANEGCLDPAHWVSPLGGAPARTRQVSLVRPGFLVGPVPGGAGQSACVFDGQSVRTSTVLFAGKQFFEVNLAPLPVDHLVDSWAPQLLDAHYGWSTVAQLSALRLLSEYPVQELGAEAGLSRYRIQVPHEFGDMTYDLDIAPDGLVMRAKTTSALGPPSGNEHSVLETMEVNGVRIAKKLAVISWAAQAVSAKGQRPGWLVTVDSAEYVPELADSDVQIVPATSNSVVSYSAPDQVFSTVTYDEHGNVVANSSLRAAPARHEPEPAFARATAGAAMLAVGFTILSVLAARVCMARSSR